MPVLNACLGMDGCLSVGLPGPGQVAAIRLEAGQGADSSRILHCG